jgi:hypothetical protein
MATMITSAEARILDAIDDAALVASLQDLVRTPSVTGEDPEHELQHAAARDLCDAGLEVDLWQLDLVALRADPRLPGALEAARNAHPNELFTGNPLPYAIAIGRVRAGDWASSVPDLLVAEGPARGQAR